ncbi:metal dependent hydrolase [Azotobacter vinelandii CA]|uniref:Metal dependent hydrolase n=2 Tax=Azotobacter vinelandii TaxID=354 RepID=C1DE22_AZOVD|nr:amidohydrolase family protein [Azotobacter vinelandii]ACO80130.1 metal dependent hydrolase [Azotobacter vinelandii DJ]AGK14481.1 metal dependent hydrolase [Azotobacter vinelandii CA]AGK21718.1 metal dependent hydrolase [Azotobacter vinelandii CA6]SFX20318.1 Cytosine/adenosine deaminase [Azotobacter vinelandii]GLK62069.1 TRZ/ATZ family hydrolase [Azotobacter vinelandii]
MPRRGFLSRLAAITAGFAHARPAFAQSLASGPLGARVIPSTGRRSPAIGTGGSGRLERERGQASPPKAMRRLLSLLLTACLPWQAEAATEAEALLVHGGYVMTMDPTLGDIDGGEVLIRDGRIVAVGRGLDAGDAHRIDARGQVVLPGFVDTHSHLYVTTMRGQFRNRDGQFFPVSSRLAAAMTPEDTRTAMQLGALELLQGGITTTADFFDNILTPAHGEAGVQALEASGIRAVMYYGGPDKTTRHPIDLAQLRALAERRGKDARVRIGLAWRLPRDRGDADNWAMRQREYDTARGLGLPIQVHVSGEPAPMFEALIQRDYLFPGLTVVHATDAGQERLQALERAGGGLALTPPSEQRVGYGLTRLDHFATVTRQGLGIDGNSLAGSADMFATLRLAALTWSGGARDERAPAPRALLELATRRGAEAVGLGDEVGTLAPGKRADLQVIDPAALNLGGFGGGDPAALLVYSARPDNVRTVLVDGRLVKRDGQPVGVDAADLLERARRSARDLLDRSRSSP